MAEALAQQIIGQLTAQSGELQYVKTEVSKLMTFEAKVEDKIKELQRITESSTQQVITHQQRIDGIEVAGHQEVNQRGNDNIARYTEGQQLKQDLNQVGTTVTTLSNDMASVKTLISQLEQKIQAGNQGGSGSMGDRKMPIMESKAVANLKTLADNKGHYREWNDKLKNVLGSLRQGIRDVLIWVEGKKQDAITEDDFDTESFVLDYSRTNEELYSLLVDKTEGEARERIKSVKSGDGLNAYRKLHTWFTLTSGLGVAERRQRVLMPNQAKKTEEIVGLI